LLLRRSLVREPNAPRSPERVFAGQHDAVADLITPRRRFVIGRWRHSAGLVICVSHADSAWREWVQSLSSDAFERIESLAVSVLTVPPDTTV
jgi:hypothetical protein